LKEKGYLANNDRCSVRLRVAGDSANINIKSMTIDIVRSEYEFPVPIDQAENILDTLCVKPLIEKTRYYVTDDDLIWEIDVFEGENAGLVMAELELQSAEQEFTKPPWAGLEVSRDLRYFNMSLVKNPYKIW
jgi:adenylate cyclase